MKYTIEATGKECIETLELHDGSKYINRHKRTNFGSEGKLSIYDQMESNGICDELLEKASDALGSIYAIDFMDMAELDC